MAWQSMVSGNHRLTDGKCWHVTSVRRDGHGGATVHVCLSSYSVGAVRRHGLASGFIGLGTKGIAHWGGKFLVGCRSESCATYPAHWEFAPAGTVEVGESPEIGIQRELMEECAAGAASAPLAVALLFDPLVRNWEIVHSIALAAPPDTPPNWEYSDLRMVDLQQMPERLSPCTKWMVEIAKRIAAR